MDNDQLEIEIKDDKYYVLQVISEETKYSVTNAWEATLNVSCKGELTGSSRDMEGSVQLNSEVFNAPVYHGLSGLLLEDYWQISVSHYAKNEDGKLEIHGLTYLIYGTNDNKQDGLLINILNSEKADGDIHLFAVKGETEVQAKKNFDKIWKERYETFFSDDYGIMN